jgi:hypothetical protein
MLARILAGRIARRTAALMALLVLAAPPARAATLTQSVRARSHAFARHFSFHRTRFSSRPRAASKRAPRPGPVRTIRRRRSRNSAEHARRIGADTHNRNPKPVTQATSPDAGVQNAPRAEIPLAARAFVSVSSDRLPASNRGGRAPSRAPPSAFSN